MKVELKCVIMECGAQYVTVAGQQLRLTLSARHWVTKSMVRIVLHGIITILKLFPGAQNYKNSHYGPGERPIHIYNLDCQSYHANFTSCRINRFPYYYTGCNKYHEVGVKCDRKFKKS